MAIQEKDLDLMERYTDGLLSDDEKKLFEAALEANIELKEAFESNEKLKQVWIDANKYEETKSRIKLVIDAEKGQTNSRRLWYIVSVAASVIILLSSYYFITQNQQINDFKTPEFITKNNKEPNNQLQIDRPAHYAKMDSISTIQLISPVKKVVINANSKIEFEWYSTLTNSDTLRIYSLLDNDLILQIPVFLSDSVIGIQSALLEEGSYYWKFESQQDRGEFIIK